MDEKPPRVSRHEGRRFTTMDDDDDDNGGDMIECSGKYCRSCSAGLIADCVALCCCPCAVVHCFALAFIKAPWVVGRRCLGLGNKNNNKNKGQKSKRKCKKGYEDVVLERNSEEGLKRAKWPNSNGVASQMDSVTVCSAFEADKVWMELYQIGHLDFGRVSFSGDLN